MEEELALHEEEGEEVECPGEDEEAAHLVVERGLSYGLSGHRSRSTDSRSSRSRKPRLARRMRIPRIAR